ncbi:hypothetical protein OG596_26525 [Streptomyces sp. NBC_01102]|uniref:hypothetical protein n=1 Tax=Streptomyces sp. NBC_01102 TaxID=2903749 RepID=UPI003866C000|nr:hypothetical protein OG596_26525 [Streptomyces sp. NBC_01102]
MSAYPLPGGRQISGALRIMFGQQARGGGRWITQPGAEYECFLCDTTVGPVTGATAVTRFVQTIRTTHPTYCRATAQQHFEGAQAA